MLHSTAQRTQTTNEGSLRSLWQPETQEGLPRRMIDAGGRISIKIFRLREAEGVGPEEEEEEQTGKEQETEKETQDRSEWSPELESKQHGCY
ncbi:hypothetical protein NDU88_007346 [Pleurodeles waltl]|uniref:Uncharacterized protein n=1 Tax=Pleurodeles waltl TaxID=8319 RepID=A0AAV7VTC7_PLEWA|nr:hypothetical protein NDU88_007346 [Pleurodeles waltl]